MPPPSLPTILAGPILRRVEPTFVSVWIALSFEADVHLSVFEGLVSDQQPSSLSFVPATGPVKFGDAHTRRFGERLHVAVVTAVFPTPRILNANSVYSYLIELDGVLDLKTLGLLSEGTDGLRPQPPLGYAPGFLPSFVTPPLEVEKLILLHGSCRKMHGPDDDALAYADKIIGDNLQTPLRPHQLFLTGDQIYADDVPAGVLHELTQLGAVLLGAREQVPVDGTLYDVTNANFPAGRRQELIKDEAELTSTDAASHLISFGEFAAMHLCAWSNAVWPDFWATTTILAEPDPHPPTWDALSHSVDELEFLEQIVSTFGYREQLGAVRRLLANIPVSMMFDDHEITDDWYLSGDWRTTALANPLARAIIRNGLAAYAVFQGWGNDPVYFETSPGKDVLDDIAALFPANVTLGPVAAIVTSLEMKFGMNSTPATIRWHYTIEHTNYRFIVLDTRTQRSYESKRSPPALLSKAALDEQIPPTLTPLDVTIIVSPAPVIGLTIMEEAFQPLYSWALNIFHLSFGKAGQMGADAEAWVLDTQAFESLLSRLFDLDRVVLLSGDVHYAFSTSLTYWKPPQIKPRRIAQLTSSAFKNPWPDFLFWLFNTVEGKAFFDNLGRTAEKQGWRTPPKVTFTDPGSIFPDPKGSDTASEPELVVVRVPRQNVISDRTRDWSWRARVEKDLRDDFSTAPDSRPETKTPSVKIPLDGALGTTLMSVVYPTIAARQVLEAQAPRTVAWYSTIGRISFGKNVNDVAVLHELLYRNPDGFDPNEVAPWLKHPIRLGEVTDVEPILSPP